MFKAVKYLLLANLYSRAKGSFIALFISVVLLILVTFIMGDFISVASGLTLYVLILVKWLLVLALLVFIALSSLKIMNLASAPFTQDKSSVDARKEKILNKERLFTKSDSILEKYMKEK